jgi:phosphate transport system substrate-binding protein
MNLRLWILLFLPMLALRADDSLTGAGATFPYPLYQKWIDAFERKFPVKITYRAIGSTAGIAALKNGEVDFAASDAPLSEQQLAEFKQKVFHIPTVVGGVVPIYNLEGVIRDLHFTPETLAGIYLGKVRRWDDPLIKSANRGISLPQKDIVVVHRSDGSGTTYIWTDYLSKVSPGWRSSVGRGTNIKWPAGSGAEGNDGVAGLVGKTPNAIGYVEFIYAIQSHLSYGAVRNASGHMVEASLSSIAAAAAAFAPTSTDDLRSSITNSPEANSYPITSFTYFLIPEKFASASKTKLMGSFLDWALTSGQKQSAALGYVALPDEVAKRALDALGELK